MISGDSKVANPIWSKYGGIQKKTKSVQKKAPMTIEEMMQKSINEQRERTVGGKGSWFKDGIVRPKCGIYSLIDGELHMEKSDYGSFLNDLERSFKNGEFDAIFKKLEKKQRDAIVKRSKSMGK